MPVAYQVIASWSRASSARARGFGTFQGNLDGGKVAEDHAALLALLGGQGLKDGGKGVAGLGEAARLDLRVALERGEPDRREPGEPVRRLMLGAGRKDAFRVGDGAQAVDRVAAAGVAFGFDRVEPRQELGGSGTSACVRACGADALSGLIATLSPARDESGVGEDRGAEEWIVGLPGGLEGALRRWRRRHRAGVGRRTRCDRRAEHSAECRGEVPAGDAVSRQQAEPEPAASSKSGGADRVDAPAACW